MMEHAEFVSLYREHLPALSKFLVRRVDRNHVEDLAADTLEIAWRKRDQAPTGMELAWLYKIAGYVVANHRRKESRRGLHFLFNDNDAAAPSAEDLAIGTSEIAAAFESLSPSDRQILSLLVFESLTIKEISVALAIAENTASQRAKRARARLAAKMQAQVSDT